MADFQDQAFTLSVSLGRRLASTRTAQLIDRAVRAVLTHQRQRRTMRTLRHLPDHTLADIGIRRAEIGSLFRDR